MKNKNEEELTCWRCGEKTEKEEELCEECFQQRCEGIEKSLNEKERIDIGKVAELAVREELKELEEALYTAKGLEDSMEMIRNAKKKIDTHKMLWDSIIELTRAEDFEKMVEIANRPKLLRGLGLVAAGGE